MKKGKARLTKRCRGVRGRHDKVIVAIGGLLHIGFHHVCAALAEGLTLFTIHCTLQRTVVPERIKEIIEQIFMENSRHKHKTTLQSRRSGRV